MSISLRPSGASRAPCTRAIQPTSRFGVIFDERLKPALRALLEEPDDLLHVVPSLCMSAEGKEGLARARRMVARLVDGLRYGAS